MKIHHEKGALSMDLAPFIVFRFWWIRSQLGYKAQHSSNQQSTGRIVLAYVVTIACRVMIRHYFEAPWGNVSRVTKATGTQHC